MKRRQHDHATNVFRGPIALAFAAVFVAACQGPPASVASPAAPTGDVYTIALTVPSPAALPKCASALAGTTAYVVSPPGLFSCIAGVWVPIPCLSATSGAVAYSSATQ